MRHLFLLAIATLIGCSVDPYCIVCPGGGPTDAAADRADVPRDTGNADVCVPVNETCNEIDDDCDGDVDEDAMGTGGMCSTDRGECTVGTTECAFGELVCADAVMPTGEGCNDKDDDCDGMIDEGDPQGGALCGTAIGECERGMTACVDGELECLGGVGPSDETCNGRDDDCNGEIDDGNPGGGMTCDDGVVGCAEDIVQCRGGTLQCIGSFPMPESCDAADNDCDGSTDEGYLLMSDPMHCGDCATSCAKPNARGVCAAGTCQIAACLRGYWDIDGMVDTGCEYACELRGAEICNGLDDDCDQDVDEDLTPPSICPSVGQCAGSTAACMGRDRWRCVFDATVSTNERGEIVPETTCNGQDDDCDGIADDSFDDKGERCTRGLGECQTAGVQACNATGDGLECTAPMPPDPGVETCNGRDDDCDGRLDEDVPDAWVRIAPTLEIYQYEASRPDSTGTTSGAMDHRPCSTPNRVPWVNVTYGEATAACAAIGARLCSEAEWQSACVGQTSCVFSYATACGVAANNTCNGNPYDADPSRPFDQDALYPTASFAQCYTPWNGGDRVYDLSGNVKEWTLARSPGVNPLRGGAYTNPIDGLRCDHDFEIGSDTFLFPDVGFRCCRTVAP